MRVFIALSLPRSVQNDLLAQMDRWKQEGVSGRWTGLDNLHLTAAFLGEQPQSRLSRIEACMQAVPFPSLTLRLQGTGRFGSLLYADFAADEGLQALEAYVSALRKALGREGIAFDSRRFRAHVTLARHLRCPEGCSLSVSSEPFQMTACSLFSSTLTPAGACYRSLYSVRPVPKASDSAAASLPESDCTGTDCTSEVNRSDALHRQDE